MRNTFPHPVQKFYTVFNGNFLKQAADAVFPVGTTRELDEREPDTDAPTDVRKVSNFRSLFGSLGSFGSSCQTCEKNSNVFPFRLSYQTLTNTCGLLKRYKSLNEIIKDLCKHAGLRAVARAGMTFDSDTEELSGRSM